jgi:hypothetical protein
VILPLQKVLSHGPQNAATYGPFLLKNELEETMPNSQRRQESQGRQQQGPGRIEGNNRDSSERFRNRGGYQSEQSGSDRENPRRDNSEARNERNFNYSSRQSSGYGGRQEDYNYRGGRGDSGQDYGESEYGQGGGYEGGDSGYDQGRYDRSGQATTKVPINVLTMDNRTGVGARA